MKKRGIILLIVTIFILSITGCTSKVDKITKMEDIKDKTIGTIVWYGLSFSDEQILYALSDQYNTEFGTVQSFDSESALMMALDSGKVEGIWLRDFQANVLATDKDKYNTLDSEFNNLAAGSARMGAIVGTEQALDIEKINDAIAQLSEDGTLEDLEKEYIEDFSFTKDYDSINLSKIEGAPSYKVAISGSVVPLDYVAADGNPTGYSIALLSKIAELAGLNFELVTVAAPALTTELNSGKIDYVFCYTLADTSIAQIPELKFSDPYYSYSETVIVVNK
jgi:ABC-type amino acid transport substrate-binding protein